MIKEEKVYFEHIYVTYFKVLHLFASRIVEDTLSAEDIVQEVFTEYWINRTKIDTSISIKPYLYKLTYHRCLDFLKSAQNKKTINLPEELSPLDALLYTSFSIEEHLHADEIGKEINRRIDMLPEKCKEVFILSRQHNLKNREIAQILNINIKSVEKHISKAIKEIRIQLLRAGYSLIWILFHPPID